MAMEVIGVWTMCEEWGMSRPEQTSDLFADASAALSMAKRQGVGKLRHINVEELVVSSQGCAAGAEVSED